MQQFLAVKDDLATKRRAYFEVFVGATADTCSATLVGVTSNAAPIPAAGATLVFPVVPLTKVEAAFWEAFRVKLIAGVRQHMILPSTEQHLEGQKVLIIG